MKILATNRKARFDYDISKKIEAGISLTGPEVKSIKAAQMSLKESFVRIEEGQAWLCGAHVPLWKFAVDKDYKPGRRRKLLLHRVELEKLQLEQQKQRIAVVPLRVYSKKGIVKVEIGVGKGRRKFDKREALRKKQMKRDVEEELKRERRW